MSGSQQTVTGIREKFRRRRFGNRPLNGAAGASAKIGITVGIVSGFGAIR
jgi:hypothetical protein